MTLGMKVSVDTAGNGAAMIWRHAAFAMMVTDYNKTDKTFKLTYNVAASTNDSSLICYPFGDKVFKTVIPRNVRLAEAPSYGLPGLIYDKSSKGAKAYQEFGAEFLKRMRKYKKETV